jgi:hypothetical protein
MASASLDVERVVLVDARLELDRAEDGALGLFGLDLVGGASGRARAPRGRDAVGPAARRAPRPRRARRAARRAAAATDGRRADLSVILDEAKPAVGS